MKIAFATIYDLRDIRRGSGTFHSLAAELERQGHAVHYVGPFDGIGFPVLTRAFKRLALASGKRYSSWQDPFIGRRLGRAVERKIEALDFDVLLTTDYTIAACTRTSKPVVLYTDAIFPLKYTLNTHPSLTGLSAPSVLFCQRVTRLGLRRAGLCIVPAARTLQGVMEYKEIDRRRTGVVPFGANLEAPSQQAVFRREFRRNLERGRIDLLFVGKNWQAKGGDVAVAAVAELNRRGFQAHLHAVGSRPDRNPDPGSVTLHGLLDKTVPSQKEELARLYASCDALILPTLGEGFGIVTVEAAAYGLPTLSYRCQGIIDAVQDGVTGTLLAPGAPAAAFADVVTEWFKSPGSYEKLARQARAYFDETANWSVATARLVAEIDALLAGRRYPLG